jgi:hypothetical protein
MNNEQNSSEDGISGIAIEQLSELVLAKWRIEKKNLRQIADELNLPIEKVQRILSQKQKSLIIQKGSLKQ